MSRSLTMHQRVFLATAVMFNDFLASFRTNSPFSLLVTKPYGTADVTCFHFWLSKVLLWVRGTLKSSHWGWWPTHPMPHIQWWQRWAQSMLPFLTNASKDTMATRRGKYMSSSPFHACPGTYCETSEVLSFCVLYSRNNVHLLSPFISSSSPLFPPCSRSLRYSRQG